MPHPVTHSPYRACTDLGATIPDTPHAVSVSLPSWAANVGYEEGETWVMKKMMSGYPRFFIHPSIQSFADALIRNFGSENEQAILFPSKQIAVRCLNFVGGGSSLLPVSEHQAEDTRQIGFRTLDFIIQERVAERPASPVQASDIVLSAAIVTSEQFTRAKSFWQHSGEGISSRRAEFLHQAFLAGYLVHRGRFSAQEQQGNGIKGPKRYQKDSMTKVKSIAGPQLSDKEAVDYSQFVEERFGRNLNNCLEAQAKLAIRKRISNSVNAGIQSMPLAAVGRPSQTATLVSEDDVYLYPTGMSSIFNVHDLLRSAIGDFKSIMFGFPYIDTLKILEKFGLGALFYGHGASEELDDLDRRCSGGERFLALFCEFPGNPLLKTPDLVRIRQLADQYGFAVVVDDTIGNFLNVHVLPAADVVVSSLTKVFSGDSNVMGGSLMLNPKGKYFDRLKERQRQEYKDNYWSEDAIFMERNSRDFVSRNDRINKNAASLCNMLRRSPLVKEVYYPSLSESQHHYDMFKNAGGGYGGLFSVTFTTPRDAHIFFDTLETEKGPSLGTNFTLSSPFVVLAHYHELEWATQFGADPDLVRVSVGLEETERLQRVFHNALEAVQAAREGYGEEMQLAMCKGL